MLGSLALAWPPTWQSDNLEARAPLHQRIMRQKSILLRKNKLTRVGFNDSYMYDKTFLDLLIQYKRRKLAGFGMFYSNACYLKTCAAMKMIFHGQQHNTHTDTKKKTTIFEGVAMIIKKRF